MAAITLATASTTGNTTVNGVTIALSTNSQCRLIVLSLAVTGTSNINIAPKYGNDFFTQVGSTVATTEGNVEMWYLTTNTESRTGFVTYSNKKGFSHVATLTAYNSSDGLTFQTSGSDFSVSGQTASVSLALGPNSGSVCITQYHSGYPSLSGLSRNGTLLYQLDRGSLISGTSYEKSTTHTSCNLYWSSGGNDDYAMINAGFISATPPPTGDITSWNSVSFADMTSLDSVNLTSLGEINTIDTGN